MTYLVPYFHNGVPYLIQTSSDLSGIQGATSIQNLDGTQINVEMEPTLIKQVEARGELFLPDPTGLLSKHTQTVIESQIRTESSSSKASQTRGKSMECFICDTKLPVKVQRNFMKGHICHHLNYFPIECATCCEKFGEFSVFERHMELTGHPEKYSVFIDEFLHKVSTILFDFALKYQMQGPTYFTINPNELQQIQDLLHRHNQNGHQLSKKVKKSINTIITLLQSGCVDKDRQNSTRDHQQHLKIQNLTPVVSSVTNDSTSQTPSLIAGDSTVSYNSDLESGEQEPTQPNVQHALSVDNQNQPKFKCDKCEKRCINRYRLSQHQLTHSNERPFRCALCTKRFKLEWQRNRHRTSHYEEPKNNRGLPPAEQPRCEYSVSDKKGDICSPEQNSMETVIHSQETHSEMEDPKTSEQYLSCPMPMCFFKTLYQRSWERHQKKNHKSPIPQVTTSKEIKQEDQLFNGYDSDPDDLQCICGKMYTGPNDNDEKWLHCSFCFKLNHENCGRLELDQFYCYSCN